MWPAQKSQSEVYLVLITGMVMQQKKLVCSPMLPGSFLCKSELG